MEVGKFGWGAALRAALLAGIAMLSACGSLPEAGPSTSAVIGDGAPASSGLPGYRFVTLSEPVAAAMNATGNIAEPSTLAAFSALPPAEPLGRVGVGDLLQITLWEANPTGTTLLTQPGLDVSLRVDPSGMIDMPYIGPMRAAGRTAMSLQRSIMATLTAQGHSIQVAVLDTDNVSGVAVVTGYANRPGAYALFIAANCSTQCGAYAAVAGGDGIDVSAALLPVWGHCEANTPEMLATIREFVYLPLTEAKFRCEVNL